MGVFSFCSDKPPIGRGRFWLLLLNGTAAFAYPVVLFDVFFLAWGASTGAVVFERNIYPFPAVDALNGFCLFCFHVFFQMFQDILAVTEPEQLLVALFLSI